MNNKRLAILSVAAGFAILNVACWWFFTGRGTDSTDMPPPDLYESPEDFFAETNEAYEGASSPVADTAAALFPLVPSQMPNARIDLEGRAIFELLFNSDVVKESVSPENISITADGKELEWDLTRFGGNAMQITTREPTDTKQVVFTIGSAILPQDTTAFAPTGKEYKYELTLPKGLEVRSVNAAPGSFENPFLIASLTRDPDVSKIADYVVCEPKVALSFTPSWHWFSRGDSYFSGNLRISGNFETGRQYKITFLKGLPSTSGHKLPKDVSKTLAIPHREGNVAFAAAGRYLPPQGALAIPVKTVNITNLSISAAQVLPQNLVYLLSRENMYDGEDEAARGLSRKPVKGNLAIERSVDKIQNSTLRLADFLGAANRGIFFVEATGRDIHYGSESAASRLVCVSDIGITARAGKKETHVWITALRSGQPMQGATVSLYSKANEFLGEATTAADGTAIIAHAVPDTEPFLVTAKTPDGSDISFIPLSSSTAIYGTKSANRDYLADGESTAMLFSDRGIYRHRDPIHIQALLRDGNAKAPAPFPVVLEMVKPDGRVFRSFTLMPDSAGAIRPDAPLSVPDDQPSGIWAFRLKTPGEKGNTLGSRTVRVEEFAPPQIRVEFTSAPEEAAFDRPLNFSIHSEHLFGTPAAGLKTEAAVTFADSPFTPEGWEGYTFGDSERSIAANYKKIGTSRLDQDGNASFALPPDPRLSPAAAISATLESTVFESGGRPVSARKSVVLHKYPHYIGIKAPESRYLSVSEANSISLALVAPDGVRVKDTSEIEVGIFAVSWVYSFSQDSRSGYTWKEEIVKSPVSTTTLETSPDSDTPFEFSILANGEYMLIVEDSSGTSSSWSFHVSDSGSSSLRSSLSNPSQLEMKFDKDSYQAGDTAKLRVTAPFTGMAMLAIEREGIISSSLLEMTNTTAVVEIPVTAEMYPNVHASATLIRPAEAEQSWSAHRAAGTALLKVDRPADRLEVRCTPTVEIVEGGSRITAALSISGATPGETCYATVFATDEAIHILTDEKVPGPYAFFSAPCKPQTTLCDLFSMLMPITDETLASGAAKIGGDDASPMMGRISPVASRRFKPISQAASFAGRVGEDGTCVFTLPEFAGEMRITAIAWTAGATGSASNRVKVSPKIVAKPDAPRFLACGDSAEFTLTVHNVSGSDAEVACSVSFTAPLIGEATEQTLKMKAGGGETLRFSVKAAEAIGHGSAIFTTKGAGETHVETVEIPVRPAMPLVTTLETLVLSPGETKALAVPENVLPSTVSRTIRAHDSYYSQFIPAVQYLVSYPHGCLEQTTSSTFPLINAGGVLSRFAVDDTLTAEAVISKIEAAITRVSSMLNDRGYWIWHDVRQVDDSLSAYACHFLAEAHRAGHTVPTAVREANEKMLIRFANKALHNSAFDFAAYSCHILALMDAPERPTMMALYDFRANLSDAGRAHLSRAFSLCGDRDRARELLAPVKAPGNIEAAAFAILAALELGDADSNQRAAMFFVHLNSFRDNRPHWSTTRNNSLALLAIGALAQKLADPADELRITVMGASGATLQTITNVAQSVRSGTDTITLRNDGKGKSYVVHYVSAIPSKPDFTAKADGVTISRTYMDTDGTPVDPSSLKPGDLVIVELAVVRDAVLEPLKDAIVEELLPACLEPEQGSLAASGNFAWIDKEHGRAIMRQDIRDDRIVFFLNPVRAKALVHYAARVVSSGAFTLPPASVEGMYNPEISARTIPGEITITE